MAALNRRPLIVGKTVRGCAEPIITALEKLADAAGPEQRVAVQSQSSSPSNVILGEALKCREPLRVLLQTRGQEGAAKEFNERLLEIWKRLTTWEQAARRDPPPQCRTKGSDSVFSEDLQEDYWRLCDEAQELAGYLCRVVDALEPPVESTGGPVRYLGAVLESLRAVHSAADGLRRGPLQRQAIERFEESQRGLMKSFVYDEAARKFLHLLQDQFDSNGRANPRAGEPLPELGELRVWCQRLRPPRFVELMTGSARLKPLEELDWYAVGAIRDRLGAVVGLCELKLTTSERRKGCPELSVQIAGLMSDLTFIAGIVRRLAPTEAAGKVAALQNGEDGPRAASKQRRGRRPVDETEASRRSEIVADWKNAKVAGVRQKEFCRDKGITTLELDTYVDWAQKRERRRDK